MNGSPRPILVCYDGSAHKYIIYKHGNKPGWHYDKSSYPSVEAAWEAVRAAFVRAFALADEGRWDEIDAIAELRSGPGAAYEDAVRVLPRRPPPDLLREPPTDRSP
jgi:hypothetical protein